MIVENMVFQSNTETSTNLAPQHLVLGWGGGWLLPHDKLLILQYLESMKNQTTLQSNWELILNNSEVQLILD